MIRRALLARLAGSQANQVGLGALATLAPLLGLACAQPPPSRQSEQVGVLAPPDAGRPARVAAWNRLYADGAGARLELEPVPEGPDLRRTLEALAAADPRRLQVVWLDHVDVPLLALQRRLRPLEGLVRRDHLDLKQYMPAALQPAYGLDERLYALPEEVDARQVYFNRDHLAEAGIDYRRAGLDFEGPPPTWAALRQANLDLVAAPRAADRLPFHPGHEGAPLVLWGWQNGGGWLADGSRRATADRREHVEALAWLAAHTRELGGAERLARTGQFPGVARTGTADDEPGRHPFLLGRLSLCFESTRFASTIAGAQPRFPLGFVEPPRRRAGAPLVSLARSWGYALAVGAPDAAWGALRFLAGEESAAAAAAAGAAAALAGQHGGSLAAPAVPGAAAAPDTGPGQPLWFPPFSGRIALDRRLAAGYRTGIELVDGARDHGLEQLRHARFLSPCIAPHDFWPLIEAAGRQVLTGGATPEAALAAAHREAQRRLDAAWQALGR